MKASIGPLPMYYETYGSGRPLLLLHGAGSTVQTTFGAILPALAEHHRVIAPEQQAHGHTPAIDRPLTFEQEADDTAALLERLGVDNVDVIGFSNGGIVAMQLAMRHPRLVHKLVVCSSYYGHAGMPPQFWEGMGHATLANMPPTLMRAFEAAQPDPAMRQRMFEQQVALMQHFTDIPDASLRAITAPALVLVGDHDVMSVEHATSLAHLLRAQLIVFPGAGHGTYLGSLDAGGGDPTAARLAIETFLDQ
ncbi:MAG: alpha/beta fold hydrolase [Deltaproteobacteria bacterium]|nr:alpha/beta fold hydrolase [Deltaproteobacteria bacterium]